MGALVACGVCGFVTRRHSRIGIDGKCPHCQRALVPIGFSAARKLQMRKQEMAWLGMRKPTTLDDRRTSS